MIYFTENQGFMILTLTKKNKMLQNQHILFLFT